jgi:hypothetical protein
MVESEKPKTWKESQGESRVIEKRFSAFFRLATAKAPPQISLSRPVAYLCKTLAINV